MHTYFNFDFRLDSLPSLVKFGPVQRWLDCTCMYMYLHVCRKFSGSKSSCLKKCFLHSDNFFTSLGQVGPYRSTEPLAYVQRHLFFCCRASWSKACALYVSSILKSSDDVIKKERQFKTGKISKGKYDELFKCFVIKIKTNQFVKTTRLYLSLCSLVTSNNAKFVMVLF